MVVSAEDQAGRTYELAGEQAYTLAELGAEVSRQTGREITYRDMSEAEYKMAAIDPCVGPIDLFSKRDVVSLTLS